jgi:hypothetical protein
MNKIHPSIQVLIRYIYKWHIIFGMHFMYIYILRRAQNVTICHNLEIDFFTFPMCSRMCYIYENIKKPTFFQILWLHMPGCPTHISGFKLCVIQRCLCFRCLSHCRLDSTFFCPHELFFCLHIIRVLSISTFICLFHFILCPKLCRL